MAKAEAAGTKTNRFLWVPVNLFKNQNQLRTDRAAENNFHHEIDNEFEHLVVKPPIANLRHSKPIHNNKK